MNNTRTSSNFKGHRPRTGLRIQTVVGTPYSSLYDTFSSRYSVSCSEYLCPETLACVPGPGKCPCPSPEDIKCIVPDLEGGETIVCTRGKSGCVEVEKLMRKGVRNKKK